MISLLLLLTMRLCNNWTLPSMWNLAADTSNVIFSFFFGTIRLNIIRNIKMWWHNCLSSAQIYQTWQKIYQRYFLSFSYLEKTFVIFQNTEEWVNEKSVASCARAHSGIGRFVHSIGLRGIKIGILANRFGFEFVPCVQGHRFFIKTWHWSFWNGWRICYRVSPIYLWSRSNISKIFVERFFGRI